MDKWQPIETAPKDGTLVDLWIKAADCEFRACDANWSEHFECWEINGTPLSEYYMNVGYYPTYWMPRPKPPVNSAESAEGKCGGF